MSHAANERSRHHERNFGRRHRRRHRAHRARADGTRCSAGQRSTLLAHAVLSLPRRPPPRRSRRHECRHPPQPPNWPASTGGSAWPMPKQSVPPLKKHRIKLDLVGCHGQTLYHQARASRLCRPQLCLHLATRRTRRHRSAIGVPVVSNFRPADMFAGGQGAPLVSLLDYVLFADRQAWPRAAEHRRHRQPHCHSRPCHSGRR